MKAKRTILFGMTIMIFIMMTGCSDDKEQAMKEEALNEKVASLEAKLAKKKEELAEESAIVEESVQAIKQLKHEIKTEESQVKTLGETKQAMEESIKQAELDAKDIRNDPTIEEIRNFVNGLESLHEEVETSFYNGLKEEPDKGWIMELNAFMPSFHGVLMGEDMDYIIENILPENEGYWEDIMVWYRIYNEEIYRILLDLDDFRSPGPETEEEYQYLYDQLQNNLDRAAEIGQAIKRELY